MNRIVTRGLGEGSNIVTRGYGVVGEVIREILYRCSCIVTSLLGRSNLSEDALTLRSGIRNQINLVSKIEIDGGT